MKTLAKIWKGLITILAITLFCSTAMYGTFETDINFLLVKSHLINHPIWMPVFYTHLVGGMLAILCGALQFFSKIRSVFPKIHRSMGYVYIVSILLIGAPTGFYMSFFAEGGSTAAMGFILMSLGWFFTTNIALQSALAHDFDSHKNWMYRSYAFTFSAVTLRLMVPLMSMVLGLEHLTIIISSAWLSWLFNLAAVETYIFYKSYSCSTKNQTV